MTAIHSHMLGRKPVTIASEPATALVGAGFRMSFFLLSQPVECKQADVADERVTVFRVVEEPAVSQGASIGPSRNERQIAGYQHLFQLRRLHKVLVSR